MENKPKSIGFSLHKITTEQFALIEENYKEGCDIRLGTNIKFGIDQKNKMIASFTGFIFECEQKPFIVIEACCHFKIKEEAWTSMLNDQGDNLVAPKGFMSHLAMLTVGTTRGILFSKTESTCFNRFVLPTINVAELVKDDTVFKLEK